MPNRWWYLGQDYTVPTFLVHHRILIVIHWCFCQLKCNSLPGVSSSLLSHILNSWNGWHWITSTMKTLLNHDTRKSLSKIYLGLWAADVAEAGGVGDKELGLVSALSQVVSCDVDSHFRMLAKHQLPWWLGLSCNHVCEWEYRVWTRYKNKSVSDLFTAVPIILNKASIMLSPHQW